MATTSGARNCPLEPATGAERRLSGKKDSPGRRLLQVACESKRTHTHTDRVDDSVSQRNLQQAGHPHAAPLGRRPNLNCGQQAPSLEGFHLRPNRLLAAGRCQQHEMVSVCLGLTYGMAATLSTHLQTLANILCAKRPLAENHDCKAADAPQTVVYTDNRQESLTPDP